MGLRIAFIRSMNGLRRTNRGILAGVDDAKPTAREVDQKSGSGRKSDKIKSQMSDKTVRTIRRVLNDNAGGDVKHTPLWCLLEKSCLCSQHGA
jgi:hypothetical protein